MVTDLRANVHVEPPPLEIDDAGVGLDNETLLEMYWFLILSRRVDERGWAIHRQGKIAFHISGLGHEAIQIAMAFAVKKGHDMVLPYYRDLGLMLAMGLTCTEFMLGLYGRQGEPSSGARQMPSHWGLKRANVVTGSSPVATQVPHAAGAALAFKLRGEDKVAITDLGEGSTSEGDFYEGLNWAGVHKLPMICVVQNNVYAISVPITMQMAVPNVADRAPMFGMRGAICDGNDILASYRAVKEAVDIARNGGGPTLLEAKTYRPTPHSSDDDDRTYRTREEVEEWKQKDPILRFQKYLMDKKILTQELIDQTEEKAKQEVDAAVAAAEAAPFPPEEAGFGPVYAPSE